MVALPGPTYLTPTWRYANDDWAGSNALTYTVYAVAPVYASDGVTITTPGTAMDLTGYTVQGQIYARPQPYVANGRYGYGANAAPMAGITGAILGAPTAGQIALSVQRANTLVATQSMSAWYGDMPTDPTAPQVPSGVSSLLVAQPMIVDPSGNQVTVGLQPLYIFGRGA